CSVEPEHRIQRCDWPIGSESERHAVIEKAAPCVTVTCTLMAETFLRPATVVDGMIRLHGRDHVQLCKPVKIFVSHVLGVLDGTALVVLAMFLLDLAEDIERH